MKRVYIVIREPWAYAAKFVNRIVAWFDTEDEAQRYVDEQDNPDNFGYTWVDIELDDDIWEDDGDE